MGKHGGTMSGSLLLIAALPSLPLFLGFLSVSSQRSDASHGKQIASAVLAGVAGTSCNENLHGL